MRARENPFRSACVEGLGYAFEGECWADVVDRVEAMGLRCAVVGGHGSGKTTLMTGLADRLRERGVAVRLVRADSDEAMGVMGVLRVVRGCRADEVLVLDAAGLMSGLGWRVLRAASRRLAGLIVSSHKVVSGLETVVRTEGSAARVKGLVARLTGGEEVIGERECGEILERHGGNVRLMFRELYDRCASA